MLRMPVLFLNNVTFEIISKQHRTIRTMKDITNSVFLFLLWYTGCRSLIWKPPKYYFIIFHINGHKKHPIQTHQNEDIISSYEALMHNPQMMTYLHYETNVLQRMTISSIVPVPLMN